MRGCYKGKNEEKVRKYKIYCPYCHRAMDVLPCSTKETQSIQKSFRHLRDERIKSEQRFLKQWNDSHSEEDRFEIANEEEYSDIGSGELFCWNCNYRMSFVAINDPRD